MKRATILTAAWALASALVLVSPAAAELGAAGQPAPSNPANVSRPDQPRGIAFQTGDVLAGVGSGQIKHFSPTGTLIQTLDTTTSSNEQTGMCFDADGNLYSTNFSAGSMSKFDPSGNLIDAVWASGFSSSPESCVFDGATIFSGEVNGANDVRKWNLSGTQVDSYDVPTTTRGSDWIDLADDGCTLFYTSEGSEVLRYDVCTDSALPNFASGLSGGTCFALRIRPVGVSDFEVLVACRTQLHRIDSSGTVVQSYPAAGFNPPANLLFAMNLDPDGTSFWTGDIVTGDIYRIDIASGNQLTHFESNPNTTMAGITVVGEITAGVPTPTPTAIGGTPTPPPTATPLGDQPIPTVSQTGTAIFIGLLILAALGIIVRMRH